MRKIMFVCGGVYLGVCAVCVYACRRLLVVLRACVYHHFAYVHIILFVRTTARVCNHLDMFFFFSSYTFFIYINCEKKLFSTNHDKQ